VAEDIPLLASDPRKVRGQHYDVVVNGWELGGGSIRIHQPDLQKTIFEQVLQIPPETVQARFGYSSKRFATALRRMAELPWLRPPGCHSVRHAEHSRRHCLPNLQSR